MALFLRRALKRDPTERLLLQKSTIREMLLFYSFLSFSNAVEMRKKGPANKFSDFHKLSLAFFFLLDVALTKKVSLEFRRSFSLKKVLLLPTTPKTEPN